MLNVCADCEKLEAICLAKSLVIYDDLCIPTILNLHMLIKFVIALSSHILSYFNPKKSVAKPKVGIKIDTYLGIQ